MSPVTLQNSKPFFFLRTDRFQAHAVSNLQIIFLLWNIVSGVVQKFSMEDKFSQEINDFLLGNQNFSIKEFTRKNGFYLNHSTLLECEFFGRTCHPEVNIFPFITSEAWRGRGCILTTQLQTPGFPSYSPCFPFTVGQLGENILL